MRTTRRLALVSIAILALVFCPAQGARPHTDPQLLTVDVRVADRAGIPVTSLNQESFQLFVGGKPAEIIAFKSIAGASQQTGPGSAEPGKTAIILFDVHSMDSSQAAIAQRAAVTYVTRHLGPNDRLAVAVYGRNLQIIQPFTGDRQKLLDAIGQPLAAFGGSSLEKGFGGAEGIQLAKNVLRSLRALADELGRLDARKSVLIFTQDFSAATGDEFSKLVETARASRVSFYTLITKGSTARKENPAPRGRRQQPAALTGWRSSPGLNGVSFAALPQQTGGPPTQIPTGPTGSGISDPSRRESVTGLDAITANADILQNLAKETYGDVVREANNLNDALDSFDLRLSNYYLLSVLLDGNRLEKRQKIEVKVDVKDLRLSYPKQYIPAAANEGGDRLRLPTNISGTLESPTAPAASAALGFQPVVLRATEALSKVVLFADATGLSSAGTANLLAVALDSGNRPVARFESLLSPEERQAPIHACLFLHPGAYRVRVALRDEKGWLSIGEKPLTIAPATRKLAASTLVISERVEALPEAVRGLMPDLIGQDYPASFKGYRVVPSLTNRANRQKPVALFFTLYNMMDITAAKQLKSEPRLVDDSGQVFLLSPVQHASTAQVVGDHTVLLAFALSVGQLKEGHYRLVLDTHDPVSKESASCETEVFLE